MSNTYRASNLAEFARRPNGTVYASEFRLNDGKSMHLRSKGWSASMEDLMYGRAGVPKGATKGFIGIKRREETGEIEELSIFYFVGPYNNEKYEIRRNGLMRAERTSKGWNGGVISTTIFEGKVDPGSLFARIEDAVAELKKGKDTEIYDLGLDWL